MAYGLTSKKIAPNAPFDHFVDCEQKLRKTIGTNGLSGMADGNPKED